MGSLPRRPNPRHTARPVKDRSTYPGSAATHEGRGGTLPPHGPPATASASSGTRVRRLSPGTYKAGDRCPPAPRPGGPDLDAGALRQYIAKPSKEGGKTTEGQRQADTHVARKPRAARRVAPGTGRSGDAAYLQERQRSAEPLDGAEGWQEAVARAERSGAGAYRCAPRGRIGEARRSGCSSALPSRRGAGTWPGSPAAHLSITHNFCELVGAAHGAGSG